MIDFDNMEPPRRFTFWCCTECGALHQIPRGICVCGVDLSAPSREEWRYMRAAEMAALRYEGRMAGTPSP